VVSMSIATSVLKMAENAFPRSNAAESVLLLLCAIATVVKKLRTKEIPRLVTLFING
jgi:hypothetical protein